MKGLDRAPRDPALRRGRDLLWVPVVLLGLILVIAVSADLLPLWGPEAIDLNNRLAPPALFAGGTTTHPFGTDALGRDVLSRLIYGARMSLLLAAVIVVLSA